MMKIDLNGKKFKAESNDPNGEVSEETIFNYEQAENIVSASYCGGIIIKGQLIGQIVGNEYLDFCYQHINIHHEIMTGAGKSYPEITEHGKIRLNECWKWTCKDNSEGKSSVIEI